MKNVKAIPLGRLASIAGRLKKQKKKIVFTNGCFDLLHAGHVRYLRKAKGLGDVLIVGVNTDASVRRLKGEGRPFIGLAHRMEMLGALECIDYVVAFGEPTPARVIARLLPDVLVKGADYKVRDIVGAHSVRAAGGRVARIAMVGGVSTTRLMEKIRGCW